MALGVREALIPVREPYRLDLTATVLRRLSTNVVDVFDGRVYRRLLGDPQQPTLLTVEQAGASALAVRLDGPAAAGLDPAALAERMLGAQRDLSAFEAGSARWGWLERIVRAARGVKPPRYPSLWEAICNAVVYQQVSIHAAGAILRRVIERCAPAHDVPGVRLYPFFTAHAMLDADPVELRALGLSVHKIVALKQAARALAAGELDESALGELNTPALLAALSAQRGIGPWTAAVIALRGFGRLDVFPMNDSGAQRSLRALAGDESVQVEPLLRALAPQQGMLYYHLLLGRLAARGDIAL